MNIENKRQKKSKNYFTKDTQNAILEFLNAKDQLERDKIYRDSIEFAFFKLTQNIIHTFKMYYTNGESIEDLQQEVIVFLLQQLHKYNPEKGAAYSYFGTIAKRYLIIKNEKNYKKLQKSAAIEEAENEIYNDDKDELDKFLDSYIKNVEINLDILFPKIQDLQVANAILEIFRKRYSIEIFNKKALYIYIREMVDANTPQITRIVKVLKVEYVKLFNKYCEDGDIYNHDQVNKYH